jgi:hypothetical protein
MEELSVKVDWETCVGTLKDLQVDYYDELPAGHYSIWLDTVNGWEMPPEDHWESTLEIVGSYIKKGGQRIYNVICATGEVITAIGLRSSASALQATERTKL